MTRVWEDFLFKTLLQPGVLHFEASALDRNFTSQIFDDDFRRSAGASPVLTKSNVGLNHRAGIVR